MRPHTRALQRDTPALNAFKQLWHDDRSGRPGRAGRMCITARKGD
ncbi:hypothetical protein ACWDF9_32800 [Streptomyces rubiginosohelvolus]